MAATEQLKAIVVGHVDHGKSTLVGRLLHDTGALPLGKREAIKASCDRRGMPFEWAFLTDGLQAERDQNISIETAQIWFRTAARKYAIIDAPGHKEFLKNMVTGAACADAALLVVDATEGVQEQSRRHAFLLDLLGVRQIAVLVNKMDLAEHCERAFERTADLCRAFLGQLGLCPGEIVPISAAHGDNVAHVSRHMPWYRGPTVVETLDRFDMPVPEIDLPLRFPVQDVYRFDHRRILAGRVESGSLHVGDPIVFSPSNKVSSVRSIETWPGSPRESALAGESIGITLAEPIFIERGQVGSHARDRPIESDVFGARIFWLARHNLEAGRTIRLRLTTEEVDCEIQSIDRVIDASTLAEAATRQFVARDDVADVTIRTKTPIVFDQSDRMATGRIVVIDRREICGGGNVSCVPVATRSLRANAPPSENVFWSASPIGREARERRHGQKGAVIWLTGLSGSGKSAIAAELERELFNRGRFVYALDGDNLRHGLSADLGFAPEDRREHIRRVAEVAKLFADAGALVITALISPYRDDRQRARSLLDAGRFVEVHVSASVAVCEQRDVKGLYKRARAGEIPEFTGVSAPYEPPEHADIVVDTEHHSVRECVTQIMDDLECRALFD